MNNKEFKKTLSIIKDLILFDTAWKKRNQKNILKLLPKKAINKLPKYRDLVKTSFHSTISNIYPNTKILLKKDWTKLLNEYIERFPPKSPILIRVAEDFPKFLSTKKDTLKKYPFIVGLALYEWLEVEVYEMEEKQRNGFLLNPYHAICTFEYPIPEIIDKIETNKNTRNISKEKTNILIYRDPDDLSVRFFELSEGTLKYIEYLKKENNDKKAFERLIKKYDIQKENLDTFKKNIDDMILVLKKNRILV